MASVAQLGTLLRGVEDLGAGSARQESDRQLLEAFACRRDETAFAALVRRHGPLVLHVCRRVLGHEQDAEDAFQAAFLVLARNAGAIRNREALGGWLHGVAYRTAMKAKRTAARRRNHEANLRARTPPAPVGPSWDDVQSALDEEVQRLPSRFREAFVLCVLQGKGVSEAAAELACKPGTIKSRVNRARELLRRRLERRGIKLTAFLAALSVAESAVRASLPAGLSRATIRFGLSAVAGGPAAATIPSHVAALAAGVTRAMSLSKTKIATTLILAAGLLTGAALWAQQQSPPGPIEKPPVPVARPPVPQAPPRALDSVVYRGRVLGPGGKPFAGADLFLVLYDDGKAPPVRATTGADGRFEITAARKDFLPAGAPAEVDVLSSLQVVATAKGFAPDWTMLGKRLDGEITLRLAPNDVTLEGRALDLEGRPLKRAKVRVVRVESTVEDDLQPFLDVWRSTSNGYMALGRLIKRLDNPLLAGLPRSVMTDDEGRFRLPGAGRERVVVLSIEAPRIEQAAFRVLPRPAAEVKALVRPLSESMMRRGDLAPPTVYGVRFDHLATPARALVGTVRDKQTGKPLSGIRIFGHSVGNPGEGRPETHTDKDGRYQLHGLPKAAQYRLFAWPSDFSSYIPGGKEVAGGEGTATATADFELFKGIEVKGRVLDKVTGKKVAASVRYWPLNSNRHPAATFFRLIGKGCDWLPGTFREMVPPGPGVFLVTFRGDDSDNPYREARADPAELARTGLDRFLLNSVNAYRLIDMPQDSKGLTLDIEVDPGKSLSGTVQGPDGKPLTGTMAKGLSASRPMPKALPTATFTALALDPSEPRQLLFVHRQQKLAGKLDVRGDEKGDVTVKLEPWGVLTGRVLDEDGRPLAGVRVHLGFPHPMFFEPATWWAPPQGEDVRTDRDGRFRAEGLTPGMTIRMSLASDRQLFLAITDTPDGMRSFSVRTGETKDLGELRVKSME